MPTREVLVAIDEGDMNSLYLALGNIRSSRIVKERAVTEVQPSKLDRYFAKYEKFIDEVLAFEIEDEDTLGCWKKFLNEVSGYDLNLKVTADNIDSFKEGIKGIFLACTRVEPNKVPWADITKIFYDHPCVLSPREVYILVYKYGLADGKTRSFWEVECELELGSIGAASVNRAKEKTQKTCKLE